MKAKIYTVFLKRFHGSHTSHMSKVFLPNVCKPATLLFSIYYRKIQKQAIIKDFFFYIHLWGKLCWDVVCN